jgi:hypothetical protein
MDATRARRIARELQGKTIGRWKVIEKIHHGKSALVLKVERGGKQAALKIFDPDLVESFGRKKQIERIKREKSLIGLMLSISEMGHFLNRILFNNHTVLASSLRP